MNVRSKRKEENENVYVMSEFNFLTGNQVKIMENPGKNEQNQRKNRILQDFGNLFLIRSDKTENLFFLKNSFIVFIFEKQV